MGLGQWIKFRWPISAMLYWGLHEPIPGRSRFAYVLGSSALFLFVLQVITGTWQMLYYVPTVDHAYASVSYLRLQVPFGWLIHGLHYWGATAFLVVLGLHLARVFIWGAYKKPRELTWLLGVLLLLLGAALMFTGAVLPWDLMGYWAGEVGLSIAGTIPGIGNFLKSVLQGGSGMGQLTLMRFFVLHVGILPLLTSIVIFAHIVAFRQFGSTGPWKAESRKTTGWFWPTQAFRDMAVALAIFIVLVSLSAFARAPIAGPADPLDQTYTPKPEWNFLFLYQAFKAFKGPWEVVGTTGIPLVLVVLLVLPPFLDRREERNPVKRPLAMACGILFAGGILSLTILGFLSGPEPSPLTTAGATPTAGAGVARPATTASKILVPATTAAIEAGKALFNARGCSACHSTSGEAGLGPDLSNEGERGRSRLWIAQQIRDPKSHNRDSIMPAYAALTEQQVGELVGYLLSLSGSASTPPATSGAVATTTRPILGAPGPAADIIGDAAHGGVLYGRYCAYCHGQRPGRVPMANPAPSLSPIRPALYSPDPQTFAQNIDRVIQHGQKPPTGPAMPDFGDSRNLTQPQIANIEAYVLQLNGVDRARILYPGVPPHAFFAITLAAFLVIGGALGGVGLALARRKSL